MPEPRWLDAREAAAWRGLLQMHAQVIAELSRRLGAGSSLSFQDYEVLVALTDRPDAQLRPFELAEALGWEKSRLSHHVARMAERGLVEKVACDSDRRGSYVAVTPAGRRAIEAAAPGHVAAVRELFIDRLRPDQLEAIAAAAEDVLGRPAASELARPTSSPGG